MSNPTTQVRSQPPADAQNRLRLWPGLVLIACLGAARGIASMGEPSPSKFFTGLVITPVVVLAGLLLWWLLASRLRWPDRLLVVACFAVVTLATIFAAGSSFPVMALILYAVPVVTSLWVGWLLFTFRLSWPVRRAGLLLVFVVVGVVCSVLRVEGMDGTFNPTFSWRWNPTSEQRLLADLSAKQPLGSDAKPPLAKAQTLLSEQAGDWPGFRGSERTGRLTGVRIRTDWEKSPPKEVWRKRIGPGWSSLTVVADRIFTQEQRGDDELVVCYAATTGEEVWEHRDATRFNEVVAGPGPRSTPTFHAGRLYTLGANGTLNCLQAATGEVVWSRDIVAETKAAVPQWGFSSSPLVTDGLVIVFAGAPGGKSLIAVNADSGTTAWTAGEGSLSYCSPQLTTIDGVAQVLITTDVGIAAFEPRTGKQLWAHEWPSGGSARVVQPALVGGSDLLIGTGMGIGTRRINVAHEGDKWDAKELWTSREIKPYYNDLVIVDDYLYGFDGNIFMCVSLKDGKKKWKARGYGNGQVLLLADQGLLLILSETGEVALVEAKPEKHVELCKFKAIEGKTWNHPVIAHGKLYVRNGEEIACFDLGSGDEKANKISAAR